MFSSKHILALFALGAAIAAAVMAFTGTAGWDAEVYWKAAQSVHRGIDPYASGIAAQQAFHDMGQISMHPHSPMTYVYSPITLPLLRIIGSVPAWIAGTLYSIALAGGFALQLWAGWQMATTSERRWLRFLLPAVAFFPGLLSDDVLLSGNVVYLLYGLIMAAAVRGWKRNQWSWYYAAVLAASCCKAPLLTLLAFPLLVGRRQWIRAGLMGGVGCLLFSIQERVWPDLFNEYLEAVRLQFDWNIDFGVGPAGLLGKALVEAGLPYSVPTTVVYGIFASVVMIILLRTARKFQNDSEARLEWLPIAFIGTILLNPRVKEYDVAILTVPMLLVSYRLLRMIWDAANIQLNDRVGYRDPNKQNYRTAIPFVLMACGWFLAINCAADGDTWKPLECALLIGTFGAGSWSMLRNSRAAVGRAQVSAGRSGNVIAPVTAAGGD